MAPSRKPLSDRPRAARVALIAAVAGLLVWAPAGTAGEPGPEPGATSVTYSGTFKTTYATAESTTDPRGIPGDTATAQITWEAKAAISTQDLNDGKRVYWHYVTLNGVFDYTVKPQDGLPGIRCENVQLKEKPGYEQTAQDAVDLTWNPTTDEYTVTADSPFNAFATTTGLDQLDKCAAFAYWPEPATNDPAGAKLGQILQPTVTVKQGGPYVFDRPSFSWDVPAPAPTGSVSADSRLVISAGVKGAPAPPAPAPAPATPLSSTAKAYAKGLGRLDFKQTISAAEGSCLQAALGLAAVGGGAGALDIVIFVVPGGAPVTGLMVFTGTMMVWAATPICTSFVKELIDDARIVKDPPLRSYTRLARVAAITHPSPPSCSRWRARSLALCTRLRAAVATLVASLGTQVAADDAVLVTIDRLSGALAAGDKASAAKQQTNLASLDARFKAAAESENQAWAHVVSILKGAGVGMAISPATDAKAIDVLEARLTRSGFPASSLVQAAGGPITPVAVNLLNLRSGG